MAYGDGTTRMQQQHGHRLTDDIGAADHDGFLTVQIDTGLCQQFHHAIGRTGNKARVTLHQGANVGRMEAINIFVRANRR